MGTGICCCQIYNWYNQVLPNCCKGKTEPQNLHFPESCYVSFDTHTTALEPHPLPSSTGLLSWFAYIDNVMITLMVIIANNILRTIDSHCFWSLLISMKIKAYFGGSFQM